MRCVKPNIVFFRASNAFDTAESFEKLKSRVCRDKYVVYQNVFDKSCLEHPGWRKSSSLVLLHMIPVDDLKLLFAYVDNFIKNDEGDVLINGLASSETFVNSWGSHFEQVNLLSDCAESHVFFKRIGSSKVVYSPKDIFNDLRSTELDEVLELLQLTLNSGDRIEKGSTAPVFLYGKTKLVVYYFNSLCQDLKRAKKSLLQEDFGIYETVEAAAKAAAHKKISIVHPACVDVERSRFDFTEYSNNLTTTKMGQIVLHSELLTSTIDVFERCPELAFSGSDKVGVVCTARRQSAGKGRDGNFWVSPAGCMMFTCAYQVNSEMKLYKNVSLLQHMVAVALLGAIKSYKGLEDLPLYIKWPNDIHYKNGTKVGGVLIKGITRENSISCLISLGFNVSNELPTISLNRIIEVETGSTEASFSSEMLLARTMNEFEEIIRIYELDAEFSFPQFHKLYVKNMMFYGETIEVFDPREGKRVPGKVMGIDNSGYMLVQLLGEAKIMTVHPDGNSFDISANPVITLKRTGD